MNKLFYSDTLLGLDYSYEQLFLDLENVTTFNQYCKNASYYEVFKGILISLITGREIILLDSDFSNDEIEKLLGVDYEFLLKYKQIEPIGKLNFEDIEKRIIENRDNWKLTLFTSGTTGLPKKISHSFESISRFVKKDEKRKNNVWGFAYNPTHMAGLQVFFQAFLNQNSIVRLFGIDRTTTLKLINNFKITNISATPTFYRMLLPANHTCDTVQNLTSGGEKFDTNTLQLLHQMFPNSFIRNVYASTEAGTIFASKDDAFVLKSEMSNLIKIVDSELYLHTSLMGESESLQIVDDWYATGDLIEIVNENPFAFKFVSRKTEMINTGGYKVNPTEVEEAIRLFNGVKDVFVYGKKNSILGAIVCCEVVRSDEKLTEKHIREYLQEKLQEYKIPRIVKFIDALTTTRTGKLSRKE
jgi:acyl-coenzyme A synthetase/AMP-(fatty) acid ligase